MKISKSIQQFATKYPKITLTGYQVIKKLWSLKAGFVNFEYPQETTKASISKTKVTEYNKARDFGPKKRICYAPFNNLHFKINGDVAACSFNVETLVGNINETGIHDIWFGKTIQQLRENLGNYNLKKCYGCKLVLESGNYRSFPANKYDFHSSDSAVYPTQMSFEISNLCNLECLMCDEELSSSIRKNKAKLPPLKDVYPGDFTDQLQEFIPHLSIATFIGGEPLLIKKYYQIWESILLHNPSCKIHLQTNATYLPQKFLAMADSGQFDIGISMEGCTKETYEKIRVKGDFETVEKNIKKLVALKEAGKIYLNFNFCPLTLNWQEVPLMLNYVNGFKAPLKLLNVETPRNLSLKSQNAVYLQMVYDYLVNYTFDKVENDFFTTRNMETYTYFIKTIESYLRDARKRDDYFQLNNDVSIHELEQTILNDVLNGTVLSYITEEERLFYGNSLNQYINELSENELIRKKTLLRFSYFFKEVMNQEDTFKDISKSFYKLRKEASEFYELEKAGCTPVDNSLAGALSN